MNALTAPTNEAHRYEIVRETWLTRKPKVESAFVATLSALAVAIGATIYLLDIWGAKSWMPATGETVFVKGEYWRLFTTLFAHGDTGHLVSNLFLFYILGFFLYGYFGASLFPAAALIGGALVNLAVLPAYDPDVRLIGASGAVYWMGGAWLILYFFLSRQKNLMHRWLRTLGVAILIFMPAETFKPEISYSAHMAGFAFGLLFGGLHFVIYRKRFQAAEVRETIIEEDDSGDELPPPEGLPADSGSADPR